MFGTGSSLADPASSGLTSVSEVEIIEAFLGVSTPMGVSCSLHPAPKDVKAKPSTNKQNILFIFRQY
jgi:hypothetical protein